MKRNLQDDVFHHTYHLNHIGLEEGHQGIRKMGYQFVRSLMKARGMFKKKVERERSTLQDEEVPAHKRETKEILCCAIKASYEEYRVDQGLSNVNNTEQHANILTKTLTRVKLCRHASVVRSEESQEKSSLWVEGESISLTW